MTMAQQFTILAVALWVGTWVPFVQAFCLAPTTLSSSLSSSQQLCRMPFDLNKIMISKYSNTQIYMAEESDETEASAEGEAEKQSEEETTEEQEEEIKEDPEITALKKEISELETTLKSKMSSLRYTQEQAEEYTKAGYARKVAEMENMRRTRNSLNKSSQGSATANVLAQFLPIYDQMNALKEKYANDEFGSGYGGLTMKPLFSKLGVTEYTVDVGEPIDSYRMTVLDSEYATGVAKNTVLRPVAVGMELQGNVVRPAECIASLGSEEEMKAAEEEKSKETAEDGSKE